MPNVIGQSNSWACDMSQEKELKERTIKADRSTIVVFDFVINCILDIMYAYAEYQTHIFRNLYKLGASSYVITCVIPKSSCLNFRFRTLV